MCAPHEQRGAIGENGADSRVILVHTRGGASISSDRVRCYPASRPLLLAYSRTTVVQQSDRLIPRREEVPRTRAGRIRAGLVVAAAALMVLLLVAPRLQTPEVASPSGAPPHASPVTESPTASLIGTPTVAATPTVASPSGTAPHASPATESPTAPLPATPVVASTPTVTLAGVETHPLGELRGDYAFMWTDTLGVSEIKAVPLGGGDTKLAVRFFKGRGGPEAEIPGEVRQLFNPDGTQLVISGPQDDLVMVDLRTGASRRLGIKGRYPKWSRDGRWISYVSPDWHGPLTQAPSRIVLAQGGEPRPLPVDGDVVEWSPDGRALVANSEGLVVIDAATLQVRAHLSGYAARSLTIAFWRSGPLGLALTRIYPLGGSDYEARLERADGDGTQRTLLSERNGEYWNPRWSPTGDQILFLAIGGGLHPDVRIASETGVRTVPIAGYLATWHPSGDRIVYATSRPQPQSVEEMRVAGLDGSGSQTVFRAGPDDLIFSIASLRF